MSNYHDIEKLSEWFRKFYNDKDKGVRARFLSMSPNRPLEDLAEKIRANFENKTGKEIGNGKHFDMTEVINFYGGIIEFANLYEDKYQLDSYIYKIEENDFHFKIVIDKDKANLLKGNKDLYNKWNLFIMSLFGRIVIDYDKINNMKNGEIIYPNPEKVKNAIESIKLLNSKKYKLIGVINPDGHVPAFVYPIFENNGEWYLQLSSNYLEITKFYQVICPEGRTLITSPNKLANIKDNYEVGDEPVIAFQANAENYFVGTYDEFIDFIKNIEIKNKKVSKKIDKFQNKVELIRRLTKNN